MSFIDTLCEFSDEAEVISFFGEAKLVRLADCKFELRGGTELERAEAREWISMFMHEAVVS